MLTKDPNRVTIASKDNWQGKPVRASITRSQEKGSYKALKLTRNPTKIEDRTS
ncbi:hypothetical protein HanHA300_Chr07g0244541 [Helianthus annuus]|nr:hypothetical protein HanHA300_Chr07g0244541 [Helianthus annuus]KAJ0563320.1 hypothetical protein HanHA89_Chr07g0261751 [Helianthus annuus]